MIWPMNSALHYLLISAAPNISARAFLGAIPFRMNTYKCFVGNFFRMNTYKNGGS